MQYLQHVLARLHSATYSVICTETSKTVEMHSSVHRCVSARRVVLCSPSSRALRCVDQEIDRDHDMLQASQVLSSSMTPPQLQMQFEFHSGWAARCLGHNQEAQYFAHHRESGGLGYSLFWVLPSPDLEILTQKTLAGFHAVPLNNMAPQSIPQF